MITNNSKVLTTSNCDVKHCSQVAQIKKEEKKNKKGYIAHPEGIVFKWQRWVSTPGLTPGSKLLAKDAELVDRSGQERLPGGCWGTSWLPSKLTGWFRWKEGMGKEDWKKGVNNVCK